MSKTNKTNNDTPNQSIKQTLKNSGQRVVENIKQGIQKATQALNSKKTSSPSTDQLLEEAGFSDYSETKNPNKKEDSKWQQERGFALQLCQLKHNKKPEIFFKDLGQQIENRFSAGKNPVSKHLSEQFSKEWADWARADFFKESASPIPNTIPVANLKALPKNPEELLRSFNTKISKATESTLKSVCQQVVVPVAVLAEMGRILSFHFPETVKTELSSYLGEKVNFESFEKKKDLSSEEQRYLLGLASCFEMLKDPTHAADIEAFMKVCILDAKQLQQKQAKHNNAMRPSDLDTEDPQTEQVDGAEDLTQEDITQILTMRQAIRIDFERRMEGRFTQEHKSAWQRVFEGLQTLLICMVKRLFKMPKQILVILTYLFLMFFFWEGVRSFGGGFFATNMMEMNTTGMTGVEHHPFLGLNLRGGFDGLVEQGTITLREGHGDIINISIYLAWSVVNLVPLFINFMNSLLSENRNAYTVVGLGALTLSAVTAFGFNIAGYTGIFSNHIGLDEVRFAKNMSDMLAVGLFLGGRFICEHFVVYRGRSGGLTLGNAIANALEYGVTETVVCLFMTGGVSDIAMGRVVAMWILYRMLSNWLGESFHYIFTESTGHGPAGHAETYPMRNAIRSAREQAERAGLTPYQIRLAQQRAAFDYTSSRFFVHGLRWTVYNSIFSVGVAGLIKIAVVNNMNNTWANFTKLSTLLGGIISLEIFFINLLDVQVVHSRTLRLAEANPTKARQLLRGYQPISGTELPAINHVDKNTLQSSPSPVAGNVNGNVGESKHLLENEDKTNTDPDKETIV